ncbi:MAG: hypothetical protein ACRDT4_01870 [Micromonosporaceae bacterium]
MAKEGNEIPDIDKVSNFLYYWGITSPREYADQMDADPDKIGTASDGVAKVKDAYDTLMEGITKGVAKLDAHWDGDGAATYMSEFLPRVDKHLTRLQAKCKDQSDDASKVSGTLQASQDKLYPMLVNLVEVTQHAAAAFLVSLMGGPVVAGGSLLVNDARIIMASYDCYKLVSETEGELGKHEWFNDLGTVPVFDYGSSGLDGDDMSRAGWEPEP